MTEAIRVPAMSPVQSLRYSLGVIWSIAWKEVRTYFSTFLAYVLAFFTVYMVWDRFLLVMLFMSQDARIEAVIGMLPQVFLFTIPLLSMRLFSEEKNSGTIELLLTSPVTEWQVVLGKFLGSLIMVAFMVGATLHMPWIASRYGNIDMGPIKGVYLVTMLIGASFLALGMFMSSWTENQVVSGFLTFGALVALLFVDSWGRQTTSTALGIEWSRVLKELSVFSHLENVATGEMHSKAVVYYLSFTFFFLYCTAKSIESRKWR